MPTCPACKRTFGSDLELAIHRDTCAEADLCCRRCGERFREAAATRDGWHYACPNDDCQGSGRGEDIVPVEQARVAPRD